MKYMGSKRAMLENGLGRLLRREMILAKRFVDLFSGSSAVAVHVAQRYDIPVFAYDLQEFCAVLAGAVIHRNERFDASSWWTTWHAAAASRLNAVKAPTTGRITKKTVDAHREWCASQAAFPLTRAYGGHYFSPTQAIWLDALRATVPSESPVRMVALAALVRAASQSAAAPGHTAQPFQPTRGGKSYLDELWGRDVVRRTKDAFVTLADQFAKRTGIAAVADANEVAKALRKKTWPSLTLRTRECSTAAFTMSLKPWRAANLERSPVLGDIQRGTIDLNRDTA